MTHASGRPSEIDLEMNLSYTNKRVHRNIPCSASNMQGDSTY